MGGQVHVSLPLVSEFCRRARDSKRRESGGFEELLDGVSFSTAGETGDMDQWNGSGSGRVDKGIKGNDLVSGGGFGGVGGVDGLKHAVESILHVGDEIFGVLEAGGEVVGVEEW